MFIQFAYQFYYNHSLTLSYKYICFYHDHNQCKEKYIIQYIPTVYIPILFSCAAGTLGLGMLAFTP